MILGKPFRGPRRYAGARRDSPADALQELRRYIKENELQPGIRLPAERDLADLLGVGRPTLREAIQSLSTLEVLVSRRGSGTYIRSLANLDGAWPVNRRWDNVEFDLIELLEVRMIIEPEAAALAANRATAEQLRNIKEHVQRLADNVENVTVREQHDYLLHDAIIRASGNRILWALADLLSPMLLKSRRVTGPNHRAPARIIEQHTAIYEAIRIGSAELAEEAMRRHLADVGVDLSRNASPKSD